MRVFITVLISVFFLFGKAGNLLPVGARSASLVNATVASTGLFSTFQNQAGLAYINSFQAGIAVENRFLAPELNTGGFSAAIPTRVGVAALSFSRFGYELYNESRYGVAFSKAFGENFSMGLQLNYLQTQIAENYGQRGVLAGEVGFRVKASDNLFIGAHVFNPTRARLAEYLDERLPTRFRVGLQYSFGESLLTFLEVEKSLTGKAIVKGALEYQFLQKFYLRMGTSSNFYQNSFGFGLAFQRLKFDLAAQYHYVMGFSPHVGLTFSSSKP